MAKRKHNIIDDIYLMMCGFNTFLLMPTLNQLTDLELCDRDGRTVLINASFCGRLDVIELLISRGANINAADKTGYTALHAAVQEQNVTVVRYLLEHGADVNAKNIFGNNPIFIPNPTAPQVLFELLIEHGADPYMENNYGNSAASIWKSSNYPESVKRLLDILPHN